MKLFYCTGLLWVASLLPALALEYTSNPAFSLKADESQDEELWISANEIDIQGAMNNDLFFFGDTVKLGGTFSDDIWGMARKAINFTGDAKDDLRIMSQKAFKLNGVIDEDLMVYADTVQLDTNSVVRGSSIIKGRVIVITGKHDGNVRIAATESVSIHATIEGDLLIESPEINLEDGTHVTGNIEYNMKRDLTLPSGVTLDGELKRSTSIDPVYAKSIQLAILIMQLVFFMTTFLFGLFFIRFFPGCTQSGRTIIREQRRPAMMLGSLVLIGAGLVAFFAFASVIGIPMGILLAASLILLVTLGKIVIGYSIGRLVLKHPEGELHGVNQGFSLFVGLLVVYLASMLPFIGAFVWFVISFLGVGTMLMIIHQTQIAPKLSDSTNPESGSQTPPVLPS